jgi:formylglycine-generating enzyme required for sulfatase activity
MGETHEVGALQFNQYGLSDVHGNIYEWCWDWSAHYKKSRPKGVAPVVNPAGPTGGKMRVLRGGCWNANSHASRSSARNEYIPNEGLWYFGFRIARSVI